jgi:L-malate glycosyltransferase
MKVLFYESRPEWGGAQKCELELLIGLKSFKFKTSFVTSTDGPMLERIRQTGNEVTVIPISPIINRIRKDGVKGGVISKCVLSFLIIPHILTMVNFILREKPKVLYTSQFRSQLLIGWLGKLLGKKVVWHIHGEERLDNFLGKIALRTADHIIVVSKKLCAHYKESFPTQQHKFKYVGNGIDVTEKRSLGKPKGEFQLIMVGALIEGKRQDMAIQACKELVERGYKVHLHIVGEKPHWHSEDYKSRLLLLVESLQLQNYVTFHGWVEKPFILLAKADLFLLPSDTEGLPLSIIEAMGVGLPCIATDVGGISELIVERETGLLISKDSLKELVEAVVVLIENNQLREDMGQAALRLYEKQFTKQVFLEGVAGVLNTVAK